MTSKRRINVRLELLRALQKDCSVSNAELGATLKIDASSISRMKDRCEKDGSIKAYKAVLNPGSFGQNTVAFVQLALIKSGLPHFQATVRFLAAQPEVQEIHSIQGEYDLLVKLRTPTNADVLAFDTKKASPKNNIRKTFTMLVLDTHKELLDIPV